MYNVNEDEIKRRFNKIKKLKQYQKKDDAEVMKIAEGLVIKSKKREDLNVTDLFVDNKEQKLAKELLDKYLKDYTIETVSDRNLLKQLIYLEVLNTRLQFKLNDYSKDEFDEDGKKLPKYNDDKDLVKVIDVVHKNLSQIINLKSQLGIIGSQKKEDDSDVLNTLKKKFKNYLKENQASRTIICPYCSQMVLLKIRTTAYDAQKHPYFRDRILYNDHLVNLVMKGTLTKEDVAKILECSPDYVDWLITKWKIKPKQIVALDTVNTEIEEIKNKEKSKPIEKISGNE